MVVVTGMVDWLVTGSEPGRSHLKEVIAGMMPLSQKEIKKLQDDRMKAHG